MKKFSIFLMAAAVLEFTSCKDEEQTLPIQANEQEIVMGDGAFECVIAPETATSVDLKQYNLNAEMPELNLIPVLNITKLENLPEYYEIAGCVMEYSRDANFAPEATQQVPIICQGMTIYCRVDAWESAHIALYSKNPRPTTNNYVRFIINATNGTSIVRLGKLYWCDHKIDVTPLDAEIPVEQNYSLVVDGQEYLMNANNPSDVYDPPTFLKMYDVAPNATVSFTIKSESGKVYGAGDTPGTLKLGGAPVVFPNAGPALVEVNMELLTYKINVALDEIFAVTTYRSASFTLQGREYIHYTGFVGIRGTSTYYLADAVTNPKIKWGVAKVNGVEVADTLGLPDGEGKLDNFVPANGAGLYFLDVNLPELTFKATHITSFGIVGSLTEWGNNAAIPDIEMTATDKNNNVYSAVVDMPENAEFKFRGNSDWTYQYGLNPDDPTAPLVTWGDSKNIVWTLGAGKFEIKVDFTNRTWSATPKNN